MAHQSVSFSRHLISEILRNVVISIGFKEAQQLRLVNRLFNDEVLFVIYISLGLGQHKSRSQLTYRLAPQTLRLVARRALQGHLTRLPHDRWTANIGESVSRLEAVANSSETTLNSHLQKIQCHHCLSCLPSGSIFDNPVSQLVCDSLVAYYYPEVILKAIYDFNDRSEEFDYRIHHQTYSPSFLIVLAACYSGDMVLLRQALNDQRMSTENIDYTTLVSSCLRVVSQQGHFLVMQYLLNAGFDVNHIGLDYRSAIDTTARIGNQYLLELLLRPEFGLLRSGHQYMFALYAAADHHDNTTRLENVKTLYLAAKELEQPRTRQGLLFRACRSDDIALAKWLMADGPIDMYGAVHAVPLQTKSTLHWLAQQGKSEWLQWFLQVQPPQILEIDRHLLIVAAALRAAANENHLELFLEIAKFFEHNLTRLCRVGAIVEDGLLRLSARLPSLLLQSTLSQVTEDIAHEANVGSAALWTAISRGRSSNVQILLERGVRTSRSVLVNQNRYRERRSTFSVIKTMLINHDNLVFTVSDYCNSCKKICNHGDDGCHMSLAQTLNPLKSSVTIPLIRETFPYKNH